MFYKIDFWSFTTTCISLNEEKISLSNVSFLSSFFLSVWSRVHICFSPSIYITIFCFLFLIIVSIYVTVISYPVLWKTHSPSPFKAKLYTRSLLFTWYFTIFFDQFTHRLIVFVTFERGIINWVVGLIKWVVEKKIVA